MSFPVTVSFSPSLRPINISVSSAGATTVRVFPGWVIRIEPWWR